MQSEYNKRSLELEILEKVRRHHEIRLDDLRNYFPGQDREVLQTVNKLQDLGQLEMIDKVIRISGGDFKVKDFESYFN